MACTSLLVLLLFSHIEDHLFQTAVQLAARREAGFHKLAPIRFALHHLLRPLRRDADIPPAGVLAQAEDIVQRYIKIGGIPDQDTVRRRRPASLRSTRRRVPTDTSMERPPVKFVNSSIIELEVFRKYFVPLYTEATFTPHLSLS